MKNICMWFLINLLLSGVGLNFCDRATITNAAELPPIHVDGSRVRDSGGTDVILRGINFNHFMEAPYDPTFTSLAKFRERLAWSHSEADYLRIKSWGLNCVRLNISYIHIEDDVAGSNNDAFDDLVNQVQWAKNAGVYIIIAYFVPPGAVQDGKGYYSDAQFWNSHPSRGGDGKSISRYIDNWKKLAKQFKDEPHVLYELLNEPQLLRDYSDFGGSTDSERYANYTSRTPVAPDEIMYVDVISNTVSAINAEEPSHVIIVNGLNYATAQYPYFRFVDSLHKVYTNLVYSFHYYHPTDFVFQDCYWSTDSCKKYRGIKRPLVTDDPGWRDITTYFSTSDFSPTTTTPIIKLVSSLQPGKYMVEKVQIREKDSSNIALDENFQAKECDECVNNVACGEGILRDATDARKSWATLSSNQHPSNSAKGSTIGVEQLDGKKVLTLSSTVNKEKGAPDEGAWAVAQFYNYNYGEPYHPIVLESNKTYALTLTLKGVGLTNYGIIGATFLAGPDNYVEVLHKDITRYGNGALSSDYDMISADIKEMHDTISLAFNVPLFLGEFGLVQRSQGVGQDSLLYYTNVTATAEEYGIGWTAYVYREPFAHDGDCEGNPCWKFRSFGLYSGWGKTVEDMTKAGLLDKRIDTAEYYYNQPFICHVAQKGENCLDVNLNVSKQGSGGGTVTSSPAGINCGTACSYIFTLGTQLVLTATPAYGSAFTGWTGTGCSGTGTCTVTLDGDKSVIANFAFSPMKTLAVAKSGLGRVKSSPEGIDCGSMCVAGFVENANVSLTASPDLGSIFAYWAGGCKGASPECTLVMTNDTTVTAVFDPLTTKKYKLSMSKRKIAKGDGIVMSDDGQMNCGGTCTALYFPNAPVTLVATASTDSTFSGWGGPCSGTDTCSVTMDKAKTVMATFVGPQKLTVKKKKVNNGAGTVESNPAAISCDPGCMSSAAMYLFKERVTLTATCDPNSVFTGWSPSSICSSTGTCEVTMDKAKTVTAKFTGPQVLTVKRASVHNGTGTVKSVPDGIDCGNTCKVSFLYSSSVVLSATPDDGSVFSGWSLSTCPGVGDCTIAMDKAKSVTAKFSKE